MGATGGRPATLYRFLDGSVGYLAPDAPSWQEADEVTGRAPDRAFRVLGARGVPAEGPQETAPEVPRIVVPTMRVKYNWRACLDHCE